jgi:hypothetical protein
MAQVDNHFNLNSLCSLPPDNILNLVNERLLKPTDQQRTSELKNYFLGYKECLETPPSPALSDQDQLFSFLEQSSTNLDEVPTISPSRRVLLQNPPEAQSQGRDNCSSNTSTRLIVSTISQSWQDKQVKITFQKRATTHKRTPGKSTEKTTRMYKEPHSQGWQSCERILSKHSSHGNTVTHLCS